MNNIQNQDMKARAKNSNIRNSGIKDILVWTYVTYWQQVSLEIIKNNAE